MSLEQALQENTATMKQLIAVLSTVAEDGASALAAGDTTGAAGEGSTGKRTRRTKAQIEADNAAAATTQPAAQAPSVNMNTTGAPIYVVLEANKTAAIIEPGHVIPSLPGLRQVSQAEYESYKAQFSGVTAAPAATQQAAQAAPSATVPSFQELTNRMVAIHSKGGNEAVMAVLSHFKVTSVPALAQVDQAALTTKVQEVEVKLGLAQPAAAAAANLFG